MQTIEKPLCYPGLWAENTDSCFISKPEDYHQALRDAGFEIMKTACRKNFALDFFQNLKQKTASSESLPPLGLHLVTKESLADKMKKFLENIQSKRIASFKIVAKPAK